MRRGRPPAPADHNARRWLVVRYLGKLPGRGYRPPRTWRSPGWYVVRICACHWNQPVTHRFDSESAALAAVDRLVEASEALGT